LIGWTKCRLRDIDMVGHDSMREYMSLNISSRPAFKDAQNFAFYTLVDMLRFIVSLAAAALLAVGSPTAGNSHDTPVCKAYPGSSTWPTASEWDALNRTVDGRLLKPPPPAAVCHPNQPTFDLAVCKATNWTDAATYANDPVGIICPNWSEDSCRKKHSNQY
jgi:hypothetical protein